MPTSDPKKKLVLSDLGEAIDHFKKMGFEIHHVSSSLELRNAEPAAQEPEQQDDDEADAPQVAFTLAVPAHILKGYNIFF